MAVKREFRIFRPVLPVCGYNKNKDLLESTSVVNRRVVWKVPVTEGDLNLEGWDN